MHEWCLVLMGVKIKGVNEEIIIIILYTFMSIIYILRPWWKSTWYLFKCQTNSVPCWQW